jgi:mannose-6-phosphate isomerase-like protein (cupin superfamily)
MEYKLPQKTEKPWGYELLWARTSRYAGKLIFVRKGHRLSFQYHEKKDETIYIHEGEVLIEIGGSDGRMESIPLQAGQSIWIQPGTRHRLQAVEDTTVFEVSTPELEDVRRLEDDYGRAEP